MARLSLAKLERHLYGAADILRRAGMDAAFIAKRQRLVKFLENLWDKYLVPLEVLKQERAAVSEKLDTLLSGLGYTANSLAKKGKAAR